MIFSLTCSTSMDTSRRLGDALQPDEAHVEHDESRHDERQDEHVQPVKPQDVHARQRVDVSEEKACEDVADYRRGPAHVDPNLRRALAEVVRGAEVCRVPEGAAADPGDAPEQT